MKIKDMSKKELTEALLYCADIDNNDPHLSNFNFDIETWKDKFIELINEKVKREVENV